jgi:trimeric autotransporter adhesin
MPNKPRPRSKRPFIFSKNFLKLFRSDLERIREDTTLNPKNIQLMNKKFLIMAFVLSNLALLAQIKAVDATNTFYGNGAGNPTTTGTFNSAFGFDALNSLTSGNDNAASGAFALADTTTGSDNTASGSNALSFNTTGDHNTANGASALYSNTTGSYNTASGDQALLLNTAGTSNTASGTNALYNTTTGNANTATGTNAMFSNTTGSTNMASGANALFNNTTGDNNTASGFYALFSNTTGNYNMADGYESLYTNSTGAFNAANGVFALYSNTIGNFNTATGPGTLFSNTTGSNNVAIGTTAGLALTTGSNNVCIGAGVNGVAGESNTTRIRNVYTTVANGRAVYVNADNKIGTLSSSRRFKEDIQPMEKASASIYALKPVTYRYKKDVDPSQALSFGLIAEDVAQVSPELITRDEEGKPQTVRYEAVNAMLLNEFLKERRKVEQLEATIAQQKREFQSTIAALSARMKEQDLKIQRVSAQIDLNRATPQLTANH